MLAAVPLLGALMIVLGGVTSLCSFYDSESRRVRIQSLVDIQSQLLARGGLGNTFLEEAKAEIRSRGTTKRIQARLHQALQLDPNNIEALAYSTSLEVIQLSFMHFLGKNATARFRSRLAAVQQAARTAHRIAPRVHVFLDVLGIAADLEGQHESARKLFRKSASLRRDPYWHELLAVSWGMSDRNDLALAELQKAEAKGAEGPEFQFQYACSLMHDGDHEAAYPRLLASYKSGWRHPLLLHHLSTYHFYRGNFLVMFRYDFQLVLVHSKYGALSIQLIGRLLAAANLLMIMTMFVPGRLIGALCRRLPILSRLRLTQLQSPYPEVALGDELLKMGHYKPAERNFRAILLRRENYAPAYDKLAISLRMQGRNDEALPFFERAVELDPSHKAYRWNLEQCKAGPPGRLLTYSEKELEEVKFPSSTGD